MKVLNLYSGIGGNRRLWKDVDVTAVEINPEVAEIYADLFPKDKMMIGDAHDYLLKHYKEFDFIWSSPQCQSHSKFRKNVACSVEMKVKCDSPNFPDCKYEWDYNGKSKYFATCPGCNSKIRIKERVLE